MSVVKLGPVSGAKDFMNEVISLKPKKISGISTNEYSVGLKDFKKNVTVFFGGDVQDYPEEMASHRDHGRYLQWNLLNMVTLLSLKFPESSIFVVRPKRIELKTFSCYDNFVPSDKLGAPSHQEMWTAMEHLKKLITNSLHELVKKSTVLEESCSKDTDNFKDKICSSSIENLDQKVDVESINIIGFSKGCVVLNQLITEAHTISTSPNEFEHLRKFWSKVRSLYWLDGGHSGGKNTWITQRSVLNTLASFPNLKIFVHVTPYQVRDDRRPWIGKECKSFVDTLKRAKADIHYKLHLEDEVPSLENHFRVLEEFT